ncbi:ribosome maturation factor RimP [Suttonella ornithocola]|uniref:Ribosome maturation factor RimP n=1 Tax=Suttonella ornithocola TaxID=279832 RepID=A0A380MUN8_9GAMM|nr:ribosome maturation factor RimP [Suttonella ornithocola]SUO96319.1 Ribosome maturation factor RimP [Suttonella ornithocola]
MTREETITELLKPVVESMGYEWWGVEYHHNSVNSILRVYVDKPEGGIGIDDIVLVTEQLNPVLDVENLIASAYTFEVSSPGIDRPLYTLAQYEKYIGETIRLQTRTAVNGQRKFTGILEAVDIEAETVKLLLANSKDKTTIKFEFSNIDKAKVEPSF